MKYLKTFELENKEFENLHHELNELFTTFRETEYLKNIWFKLKYDYISFELSIIWFYSNKTTKLISTPFESYRIIYIFTKQGFNLKIQNYITNEIKYSNFNDLLEIIKKICYLDIKQYLDYTYYPNLEKIMRNNFIILDYDKFLEEFEEELKKSSSKELYNGIDNIYALLQYVDSKKLREIVKNLKNKYEYIIEAEKYNL